MNRGKYNKFFSGLIGKKPRSTIYDHSRNIRHSNPQLQLEPIVDYRINSAQLNHIEIETNLNNEIIYNNLDQESSQLNISINEPENLQEFSELDLNDKKKYICISLLSLFYAGNFTQAGLELIVKHLQNFLDFKLPRTFDQIILRLDPQNLEYKKQWFCPKCQIEVELNYYYQRECHICDEKTKLF